MSVFKGYLRGLIRLLKQIRTALNENDIDTAKTLVNELIEDTQKSIED